RNEASGRRRRGACVVGRRDSGRLCFHTVASTTELFEWTPIAHRKFDETPRLLLIRYGLLQSFRTSGALLEEHLNRAALGSYGMWSVFGAYDVLVLAWMTEPSLATVRDRLSSDGRVLEFYVQDFDAELLPGEETSSPATDYRLGSIQFVESVQAVMHGH